MQCQMNIIYNFANENRNSNTIQMCKRTNYIKWKTVGLELLLFRNDFIGWFNMCQTIITLERHLRNEKSDPN